MTAEEARAFAEQWAADWNELAVERVLAHFHDQVVFTSPTALAVVGVATVLSSLLAKRSAIRRERGALAAQV